MFRNFRRITLVSLIMVSLVSVVLPATQGTLTDSVSPDQGTVSTFYSSGLSVFGTSVTLPQRLFRTGGPASTCDTPLPAPTQNSPTGTFSAKRYHFMADYTGCMTIKMRGTNSNRISVAAYAANFNADNVKQNLVGYSGDWVDERGETTFFSFRVQSGVRYDLVTWSAESGVQSAYYMIEFNNSLARSSDFDGDGQTDSAVFRPSTGAWYILQSSNNTVAVDFFGSNGDVPLDGDFDGDGKTDLGIFRPSNGTWYYKRSSNGTFFGAFFGLGTDKPVPGDYDKDGITDIGAFRDGNWLISPSSGSAVPHTTVTGYPFGSAGDIPVGSQRK